MKRAVYTLLLGILLLVAPMAKAETTQKQRIVVSPASSEIAINPGEVVQETITVVNKGTESFKVSLSASPYVVQGDGRSPRYTVSPGATDASAWIRFTSPTVGTIVEPEKVQEVSYEIAAPITARPGGHTVAVLVTAIPVSGHGSVTVYDQVAIPQYITVKGEVTQQGAASAVPLPRLVLDGALQMPYSINNTGGGHFVAKVTSVIKTIWGKEYYRVSDQRHILPGTERRIDLSWRNETAFGIYKVERTAEYLGRTEALPSHWVIVVRPGVLYGTGLILLGGIGYAVTRSRRRS